MLVVNLEKTGIMRIIKFLYNEHRTVIITTIAIIALCTIYPPVFRTIYETGRDFGSSVVRALLAK